MQLRIGLIAPPWYPVPPAGYGGIELVVGLLAEGLRAAGHSVTTVGAEGSDPRVTVRAPRSWRADLGGRDERLRELTYATRAHDTIKGMAVDVIHDHCGYATLAALCLPGSTPVVHTVHGVVGESDRTFLQALGDRVSLGAISASQRSFAPGLNWAGVVHNAVDVEALAVGGREEREGYLVCLARICPDKGQHLAIEAARRSGRRLVLAGKVDSSPEGRHYFRTQVEPHLDGDRVIYIPEVAGREKARLLARAAALVAPIQWPEPFGLALVEAMACGTPAIAMARGAAPELVVEGVTGFLVEDVHGMVGALSRLSELDGARCAEIARERFHPRAMSQGYLEVYRNLLAGRPGPLPATRPIAEREPEAVGGAV